VRSGKPQHEDTKAQRHKGNFLCVFLFLIFSAFPISAQDDLITGMSLEQRVAQLFIVNLFGSQLNEPGRDFLRDWQPGGVVLIGENNGTPEAVTRLTNSYQRTIIDAGGLPLFVAVDQEPGPISHLKDGFTQFPTPSLITATGDLELAYIVGEAIGDELVAVGVNMNLSPIADLETNPRNPIILRRSFGDDPAMVSPMIGAVVEGTQAAGVLATAKHFPGHGNSNDDSHTGLPVIDLSRERLESVELAPFRAAIEADVGAIMVAHIWYPALEAEVDLPASLSANIITGLLREEMGYQGLIITDALDMDAIDTAYSYPEAVVKAIQAGVDLVISAHIGLESQQAAIQSVVDAVNNGVISEARINESVVRILAAKEKYGILDWKSLDPLSARENIDLEGHAALIDDLFRAGVSVAFDRENMIPIVPGKSVGIAYLTSRYQIVQECSQYRSDIRWAGVSDSPTASEIAAAVVTANLADTMIVFTQNADENPQQQALVQALLPEKTVVVALFSPYDITKFPGITGYMVTYSPARPAVPTACGILFGAIPANGRLAVDLAITPPSADPDAEYNQHRRVGRSQDANVG
jgi:beta-N-acetylhexosaminidase